MDSSDSEDEAFKDTAAEATGVGAAIGAKAVEKAKNKVQVAPAEVADTTKSELLLAQFRL